MESQVWGISFEPHVTMCGKPIQAIQYENSSGSQTGTCITTPPVKQIDASLGGFGVESQLWKISFEPLVTMCGDPISETSIFHHCIGSEVDHKR